MKLLVLIGTDYHLNQLPHFLAHYTRLGVDKFLCGVHGQHAEAARAMLAPYPCEIVADYGTARYDQVANSQWVTLFNHFRRHYVRPDEWCLFADVDEFHEYPVDFFANLDPQINAVRGRWIERLATSDGQMLPCSPEGNIGQQFPYATRKIFCGISQKVMAVRADLALVDGYHYVTGGTATPVYYAEYLNVHHFRWDERAAAKYQGIRWTRHYHLASGYIPALRGVFYINPPFPAVGSPDGQQPYSPKFSVIMPVQHAATRIGAAIASIQAQTFTDWELLVIDAGSTDPIQAVVARYVHGDRRIRVVPAAGHLAHAWRQGLTLARGGYIYGLDANHRSLPDTLQRLYERLETQLEAVVAYGAVAGMPPRATPLEVLAQLAAGQFFHTGAVALRRAALEDALAVPETEEAEQTLWWCLAAQGAVAFVEGSPLSAACASPPARVRVSPGDGRSTRACTPVKLAYLIVAHHQPKHLARLIRALDQDNSAFFIHIDAKVPLAPFTAVVPQRDNLIFLPHRVEVQWGRVSVVHAVLQLIHTAVASGQAFTYYILLSGSDYPIKDKHAIGVHFQDGNRQYIRIDRQLTSAVENPYTPIVQNLPQGKYFGHLTPYHGSMYWSLTADCIRFILDFVHDNPGYVDMHQHICVPDEVFFHTLVKHSPFAEAITHDFADGIYPDHTQHGNHFIDWAGLRQRHYLTLDERDFADLLASEALFARKFDEHTSRTLLDLLDAHVHECHVNRDPQGGMG